MQKLRYDLQIIVDFIKNNSSVIDIGCGDGDLLRYLQKNKFADCCGLEISKKQLKKESENGFLVAYGDADFDLSSYSDKSFNYAILSLVIQETKRPDLVLKEALRIAEYVIVSISNFAYIANRIQIVFNGKMPTNKTIPYLWYKMPNNHLCSILDFKNLCKNLDCAIKDEFFFNDHGKVFGVFANLFAKFGIFLITKNHLKISQEIEFTGFLSKSDSPASYQVSC